MRSEEEIQEKIDELQGEIDGFDHEFEEALEMEETDEFSEKGKKIENDFEEKKKVLEEQIELLEWVLEE